MAGMTMPEMANGEDQQAVSAISRLKASHPSIGEMGPCEKQACDNGSAVFAKTTRSGDSHFHSILAIAETPRADGALTLLRDARDDIATYQVRDGSPLHLQSANLEPHRVASSQHFSVISVSSVLKAFSWQEGKTFNTETTEGTEKPTPSIQEESSSGDIFYAALDRNVCVTSGNSCARRSAAKRQERRRYARHARNGRHANARNEHGWNRSDDHASGNIPAGNRPPHRIGHERRTRFHSGSHADDEERQVDT